MDLYEYQAKSLLQGFQIPLLKGRVAYSIKEAVESAQAMGGNFWVIKAQIRAGGRGKAGGIILARSLQEVESAAQKLLNQYLITPQTDPAGEEITCVYIEQGCAIEKEFYLSLALDRHYGKVCLIASKSGGVNIEEVSLHQPENIAKILIDPYLGIQPFRLSSLERCLHIPEILKEAFTHFVLNLYQAYNDLDATLIEINPFVITADQRLYALDAKISIDDNALYRHSEFMKFQNTHLGNAAEETAHQCGLNYVKLDGTIGCMVNGAGLAMATMDLIQFHGGKPANFLDVGGGADQERVKVAFQIILADPQVKAIFINIFGGIIQCDIIAQGIIAAAKEIHLALPIVVRLQGTNHEQASQILLESGLPIMAIEDLDQAAQKVVKAASET